MFLDWINITVSTVFDLLWYLVWRPPPPTYLYLTTYQPFPPLASPPSSPKPPASSPKPPTSKPVLSPKPSTSKPLASKRPTSKPSLSPKPSTSQPSPSSKLPAPPQPKRPAPLLFALIIGIDNYLSDKVKGLRGAVADANALDEFLQQTLGVPKVRIRNLRNEQATRVAIQKEIQDLGNNPAIRKDDPILIFFAGHGAETKAPLRWSSAYGKIQMLLPYDFIYSGSSNSGRGQGVLDIILSRLLKDLAEKKSDNITVILDCCNSGSGTRTSDNDPTSAVRGIDLPETYTIAEGLLRDVEPDARASVVAKGFEKTGLLSHVLLAACKAEQKAKEEYGHGVFTSALLSLLREKGVDKLTYKDVINNLAELNGGLQDPQCEGVHQTRYLFDSKVASSQLELYLISPSSGKSGQYTLEAGEVHGITNKAEYAVFADRTMTSTLGTVVVSSTAAFTSSCKFFPAGGDETPFRLVAPGYARQTRVGEGQDVRLFIRLDEKFLGVFQRIASEMQSDKAGKRAFSLVDSPDATPGPDLAVTADEDTAHFEIMEKVCIEHGLTRMPVGVNINDSDTIYRVLRSSADFYWHLHRSIENRVLASKVILERITLEPSGEINEKYEQVLEPDESSMVTLNDGDVLSVDEDVVYGYKITSTATVPLFISVFYFDMSDLSIDSYYQPGSAKNSADVSLPPRESLTIGYGPSGTVPHSYIVPEGQETDVGFLKLFISTKYVDLSGIVQTSPFSETRGNVVYQPKVVHQCFTMRVALVQKKKKNLEEDASQC